jgi:predicted DNA-binding transcriptional regulator AlpA
MQFKKLAGDLDLDPAEIFRPRQAAKYFGFSHSHLYELVKAGKIEAPIPLSDGGSAVGWTGLQLILHHRKRLAAAKKPKRIKAKKKTLPTNTTELVPTVPVEKVIADGTTT